MKELNDLLDDDSTGGGMIGGHGLTLGMHLLHELQSDRKFTDLFTTRYQDFREINCLSVFHQQLKVLVYFYTFKSIVLNLYVSIGLLIIIVNPSIHPFTSPSIHSSVYQSIHPSVHTLFILYHPMTYHTFIHSSIHTIQLPILLFIHPSHNHQLVHPSIQTQTESSKHYLLPFMQMKDQKTPLNKLYQQVRTAMLHIDEKEGSQAAVNQLLKVAKDW